MSMRATNTRKIASHCLDNTLIRVDTLFTIIHFHDKKISMIVSTISFAMHILVSSFRVLKPVAEVLELVLPYRNMATKALKSKINFNTKHLGKGLLIFIMLLLI